MYILCKHQFPCVEYVYLHLFQVCAPLYTQIRGQALWYTGKCFHSDRSLKNFTSYVFCNTGKVLSFILSPALCMLFCLSQL